MAQTGYNWYLKHERDSQRRRSRRARGSGRLQPWKYASRKTYLRAQAGASAEMEHGSAELPSQDLPPAIRILLSQCVGHHLRTDRGLGCHCCWHSGCHHRGCRSPCVQPHACFSRRTRQTHNRVGELLEDRIRVRSLRGRIQGRKLRHRAPAIKF